jgi:HEPN domain-containing protein
MADLEQQVAYWRDGARDDRDVARLLIDQRRLRHGLFLVHLSLEKLLKAHVCRRTGNLAPRVHSLPRLAQLALLSLTQEQMDLLADLNVFNIEGRYPDIALPPITENEAEDYARRAEELFQWLTERL